MLQSVQNPISILAKSIQCPTKYRNITIYSLWCHNRVGDVTIRICDDATFSFKGPHAMGVLNDYSASINSGDLETEWWDVRIVELFWRNPQEI